MNQMYTPGPWRVGQTNHGGCRIYSDSHEHAIARTYGHDLNGIGVCSLTGPENKADALLIAAAPELLAALELMMFDAQGVDIYESGASQAELDDRVECGRTLARAALAKVKGS